MTSRKEILDRIQKLGLEKIPLPEVKPDSFEPGYDNLLKEFIKNGELVGAQCILDDPTNFFENTDRFFPETTSLITSSEEFEKYNTIDLNTVQNATELEDLDIFVVQAAFGIAENGAVWIPESVLPIRVLPFICKHLVILVDKGQLVSTMHEAYQQLEDRQDGFGLFISGPSKTADIEQSLVIGAQGALSVHLLLS